MHELVTIDTDFIDARFNYETKKKKSLKKCEICQKNKITQHKVKINLQITTTP